MPLDIISANEITEPNHTFLIYANPGMGKTTALKFIPGKKLVIDVDKSSSVLEGEDNIGIAKVDTYNAWEDWMNKVKTLLTEPETHKDYDVIVIDNISELFRATLTNLGRMGNNNRVPSQADYQRVDFTILDSLRALQNLNKTLVFTAWETTDNYQHESGQTFTRSMPDIRPKILNNFLGLCDVVGQLVITTDAEGNEKRGFILQPNNSIYAKNRLSNAKGCKVEELFKSTVGDAD